MNLRPYQQRSIDADQQAFRDRVFELLDYDRLTGLFTWKVPRKRNQVKAGSTAGSLCLNGYISIGIDSKSIYAHRLAWFVVHGVWPAHSLDHIDGNPTNNAIANLREATQAENAQNLRRPKSNSSGVTGVHWHKQIRRWQAYVTVNGKRVSAGCYSTKEEAAAARMQKKAELHTFHPWQVGVR